MMYFIRPDLVNVDAIKQQSGEDQGRLKQLPFGYTGIWWFARYPNHFASDVAEPNKRLGELLISRDAGQLAELISFLKKDNTIEELQQEFEKKSEDPVRR
jgi:creatinine amidohydrolase